MQLTIHTPDTAPAESKATLEGIQSDLGFIPNMAGAAAESPTLLKAFDAIRRAVNAGSLDPTVREVAGLATGVAVDNHYGVAFHSTRLATLGVDESDIDRMRAGDPPTDDRLAAIYELARRLVAGRGKVDVADASAAGFSDAEILEVVAECTFAGLVGTVDNLAGRVALDEFLTPRAWTAAVAP